MVTQLEPVSYMAQQSMLHISATSFTTEHQNIPYEVTLHHHLAYGLTAAVMFMGVNASHTFEC